MGSKRQRYGVALSILSIGLLCFVPVHSKASSQPKDLIADWLDARCGSKQDPALWAYQGSLVDPVQGRPIAHVQGLEWQCPVTRCTPQDDASTLRQACSNWIAESLLLPDIDSTFYYQSLSAVIARKVFCYTSLEEDSSDGGGGGNLLTALRLRPTGPVQRVPSGQAIAAYETKTCYIGRDCNELVLHTELSPINARWGATNYQYEEEGPQKSLKFTIFTRKRSKPQLPDLSVPPSRNVTESSLAVSPKRMSLIQFGASKLESQDRFGARETYAYTFSNAPTRRSWFRRRQTFPQHPSCQVQYTRYGEGPPFYAPNRFCSLELNGRRIAGLTQAPPLIRNLVEQRIPNFFHLDRPLAVAPDPHEVPPTWMEQRLEQAGTLWGKVIHAIPFL